jgi:hypothetical protein
MLKYKDGSEELSNIFVKPVPSVLQEYRYPVSVFIVRAEKNSLLPSAVIVPSPLNFTLKGRVTGTTTFFLCLLNKLSFVKIAVIVLTSRFLQPCNRYIIVTGIWVMRFFSDHRSLRGCSRNVPEAPGVPYGRLL